MGRRVVVMGQGYVGLPLAVRAAQAGHHVVGYDVDADRIKALAAGESPIEDVTAAELAAVLDAGRYVPTCDERDVAGYDIALIAVPTPLRERAPDLSYVEEATRTLARHLRPGAAVALESTTYPGTTDEVVRPLLEQGSGLVAGTDFHLGFSPERIDPRNERWNIANTPKLVGGIDAASTDVLVDFYGTITGTPVRVSSPKVAELAKLIENTFRHVNIALINEIAIYAHELGIDIWEAVDAAATKPFGFLRFTPGPGVGGHCLPVDPEYLSWQVHRSIGRRFRFIEIAAHINNQMPAYAVQRLLLTFNRRRRSLNGARVLVLGLAYKPNTGDTRESPALRLVELLLQLGAQVRVADPHVADSTALDQRVERVRCDAEELAAADAVIIVTDHDAFDYELIGRRSRYVFDCRRRLAPADNVEFL